MSPGMLDIVARIFQVHAVHSTNPHWDDTMRHGKSTLLRCTSTMNYPNMSRQPTNSNNGLIKWNRVCFPHKNGIPYLFIDLDGFLIVFKLSGILCNLQHALIGWTGRFFTFEIVSSLFIMLNGTCLKRGRFEQGQ